MGNTFFKVLGKQVELLKLNLVTIMISFTFSILGAYVFDNMLIVIVGMVISVVIRSVFSDVILSKYIDIKSLKYDIQDIILAFVFVFTGKFANWLIALSAILLTETI